jgi:signal transduction histidine kinase
MTSSAKRPVRLLLLEDQDADEALLRRNLSQTFALTMERVQTADGLRRALASSVEWDIVISDYSMPSFTALDALEIVKEDGRDLPFIIVSGTMPDETALRAMREGARDYVMKDNLNRLRPAVERELDEAARRRALRLAEAERDRLLARERELREAAEAGGRLKDEFLSVLSHELRTPLTCILGWARLLRHEPLAPRIVHGIEAVERSGRVLTRLIEDLLDLSAILSGRIELHPRSVDFSRLVRNTADAMLSAAAQRGLTVHVDVADDCRVWGDPDRLDQIVDNLLTNSIKFTPQGGQIWVSLQCSDSQAAFVVRDNGVGIPVDFLPHVFDRFRQADGSVSRAFGGLGLGLSIARDLTEMQGGRVWAESEGAGQGAMFTLQLPTITAAKPREDPALPQEERAALHGKTVLLVDDDPADRDTIRNALERFGTTVVCVTTTAAAIQAQTWAGADLLICDLATMGADGHELMATLRQLPGDRMPALALGAGDPRPGQKRLAAGFDAYVAKPITSSSIVAPVVDLLCHLTSR